MSSDWLPSLNALRALEVSARRGSFQAAADELGVTTAAVHQLVRGLEATLDKKLIVRRGRRLFPTNDAEAGLANLHQSFDLLSAAVRSFRARSARRALRVSVEPSFAAAWLVGRLRGFQHDHPEIDVLVDASFEVANLERDDADLAIRYMPAPTANDPWRADMLIRPLFVDETIVVCAPALHAPDGRAVRLDDLASACFINFEWPQQARIEPTWADWLAKVGRSDIVPQRFLRFTDYNMALQAAIGGQGFALVSRPLVQEALDSGLLTLPFATSLENGYAYCVAATHEAAGRPEVEAFIDWICAKAG